MSVLLDAGPALNFLAVGQQNILIRAAGARGLRLATAERVDREVTGKFRDRRFRSTAVERTWGTLKTSGRLEVRRDDLTTHAFGDAVARISGLPAAQRVRDGESLGEIMVIAHASVLSQDGIQVYVLMDDGDGRRRANIERAWLTRHGHLAFRCWTTPQLVKHADPEGWIKGDESWEQVYDRMRRFDDGLPPR